MALTRTFLLRASILVGLGGTRDYWRNTTSIMLFINMVEIQWLVVSLAERLSLKLDLEI